jgi:transcriptional regulator with XRE-family HTH domain
MKYGRAIRLARAARGMSKKQLAATAQIDASYITLIEQDKRAPSSTRLAAIAAALRVPVHLLSMLGAEASELKGITPQEAEGLGRRLLEILIEEAERGDGHEGSDHVD